MGTCKNHPDIEGRYQCMKHNYFLCEECLDCKGPSIYCKYRSSCPINFLSRKGFDKSGNNEKTRESQTVLA